MKCHQKWWHFFLRLWTAENWRGCASSFTERRSKHLDAAKGAEFKEFPTLQLWREYFGKERIDAANALLKKLQPQRAAAK